jgi:hypothetical protein
VRNVPFGLLWPLFHRARLQTQDSVRRDEGRGIAKENQRYGNNNNDINPIRLFSSTAHIGYIHTYCLYIRRSGRERETDNTHHESPSRVWIARYSRPRGIVLSPRSLRAPTTLLLPQLPRTVRRTKALSLRGIYAVRGTFLTCNYSTSI